MAALLDSANLDLASTPGLPPAPPGAAPPGSSPAAPSAIPTAQQARLVYGQHTEVLVQVYADRILVIVTQLGRIGCMIQVSPPPPSLPAPPPPAPAAPTSTDSAASLTSILSSLPPPHPSTALTPLFGVAPTPRLASLHDLYAAQIGAIVFRRFAGESDPGGYSGAAGPGNGGLRPVVLGIGLKPTPPGGASSGQAAEGDGPETASGDRETDEDGDEMIGLSGRDKETFAQVMEMVVECLD